MIRAGTRAKRQAWWACGSALGVLALGSSLAIAQGQPEDLLPPGFEDPAPGPAPSPAPSPAPAPAPRPAPSATATQSGEIVQPIPQSSPASAPRASDLDRLPTLRELENLSTDELDQLLGLRPSVDIPAAAQRSTERVGVLSFEEGGIPSGAFARQPAALVRAALAASTGPVVSRWGHILLRRVLASRLAAPDGMDPVEFAGLRARTLNAMGEFAAARALVQDVDTANYDPRLTEAAINAYIGTADIVGACPVVRIGRIDRDDAQWRMLAGICNAYAGEATRAGNDLRRLLNTGAAPRIDALLAQRFAGAAGNGRRGVTIEWDGVEDLTPIRFALANAVGEAIPDSLQAGMGPYYRLSAATAPMLPLPERAESAEFAAAQGVLSSRAIIDLYSQIFAIEGVEGEPGDRATRLRRAYVDSDPAARLSAIREIWGGAPDGETYGRYVLTSYAAARMPADEAFADDAAGLVAAMLTAGLDRDAQRWMDMVDGGSLAWGILAAGVPQFDGTVSGGDLSDFFDNDPSARQAKSRLLVAGLAGLGRIDASDASDYSEEMSLGLGRESTWSRAITRAAQVGNPGLVAVLAGLGMQGSGWERMTPLHLYHIVRALDAVGMNAEARMIAAEAVARA